MKVNLSIISIVLLLSTCLASCDDGKIYPTESSVVREGGSVRLTATAHNEDSWPSGYNLVIAGFGESEYATISKNIVPEKDGTIDITLTGIPNDVTQIELCVIDRLRIRVHSFYQEDYAEQPDTIRIDVGEFDANMYNSVQTEIFNKTCTNCHGGSNEAAAGLYLTEGKSYKALVNIPADKSPEGMPFVTPGDVENSFLHHVLNGEGLTLDWNMDHEGLITSYTTMQLLDNWIKNGAKE